MTNEATVPTQPLIDFEAAWVELHQLLIDQHKFLELFSPENMQVPPNPFMLAMQRLQTKHTREVPIQ